MTRNVVDLALSKAQGAIAGRHDDFAAIGAASDIERRQAGIPSYVPVLPGW